MGSIRPPDDQIPPDMPSISGENLDSLENMDLKDDDGAVYINGVLFDPEEWGPCDEEEDETSWLR